MVFSHTPIMLAPCIDGLSINPQGIYVDGTLGGGGHSRSICEKLDPTGILVGVDQDLNAIMAATQTLAAFSEQTILVRGSFFDMASILDSLKVEQVNGFLLDLGVSSHQLDEASRGFSYMHDAPLDMRMDATQPLTAFTVVNTYSESHLTTLIADYGEERWAKRIAQFIVAQRDVAPINTTHELVTVIKQAVPKAARTDGPHPAKRTFQAIRIEVNNELAVLSTAITAMVDKLKPGGRICIITFHSLEDRIVKNTFKDLEQPCKCPMDIPVCVCHKTPILQVITRKPITPSPEELEQNPRARSAKLRIAEKR